MTQRLHGITSVTQAIAAGKERHERLLNDIFLANDDLTQLGTDLVRRPVHSLCKFRIIESIDHNGWLVLSHAVAPGQ